MDARNVLHRMPEQRAEGSADQQDRRQRPARRAGPERDPPRNQFRESEHGQGSERELTGEHRADLVVAHAQDAGDGDADAREAERADRRPPELVHR